MPTDLLLGPSAVRDYARRHTLTAMRTITHLCNHAKKESTRLAAARELLDRGWGRPIQAVSYEHTGGSELLTILQDSYGKAIEQLSTPVMIEEIAGETTEDLIEQPSRVRPRLKRES